MENEKKASAISDVGAWGMNVVSSVGIIMANKQLMSGNGYDFSFDWRMVLLDMRNHGKSTDRKLNPPHTMDTAAKDLADLVNVQRWPWPEVVIGHSMGGKVAMQFAESCSRGDYGHTASLPKQVDTLAYHLSVLKDLFPKGINLLSLFFGIGGAEVTLYRLGIPLKNVVSVEKLEVNRSIVRSWWDQTNQKGNLYDYCHI